MTKRLVIISDTHEKHREIKIPDGDILIHCGDFTNRGSDNAIRNFLNWFSEQPHTNKIFICGNHELGTDREPTRTQKLEIIKSFTDKDKNLHYLENSTITIDGFEIYGSPHTPLFHFWAWNVNRGADIAKCWKKIPDTTQILIQHGQPYGIFDLIDDEFDDARSHQGCKDLMDRIDNLPNLKLVAGGHLHLQGGNKTILNNKIFVNAAICDDYHQPTRNPVVVDL